MSCFLPREEIMNYVSFEQERALDLIALGRVAIDFNPLDYFKPLSESKEYRKYLGGSPANVAVGLARLGGKAGFIGKVSDDRFGDYVTEFFAKEGIDISHITRAEHGEKLGLTFTEILSPTESSILMYRDGVADLMLEPQDVDEEYIASAKALLVSGTALAQSPSREAALKAILLAKKCGTRVIFDIDYRPYNWKNKEEISVYYTAAAEKADVIMGSREEYDLTESIYMPGATDETRQGRLHRPHLRRQKIRHQAFPGQGVQIFRRRRRLRFGVFGGAVCGQGHHGLSGNGQRVRFHAGGGARLFGIYAHHGGTGKIHSGRKKDLRRHGRAQIGGKYGFFVSGIR